MDDDLTLRAFREGDLEFLDRLDSEPAALGVFEWFGFRDPGPGVAGGSPGSCYEIGAALLPEHRGRGLGTAAQRLLVDHLFRFTTVHRLEAGTDAGNVAEQKSWSASASPARASCARSPSATAPGGTACCTRCCATSRLASAAQLSWPG
jgi:GNAT superfamily N-acetyltransferase